MSTKIENKKFLSRSIHSTRDCHILDTRADTPNHYSYILQANTTSILKKYPGSDPIKIRELLEELDNNLELAVEIMQEQNKSCNSILEEDQSFKPNKPNLNISEQNAFLKKSFLSLYKKMIDKVRECEELEKKYTGVKRENQILKLQNRMLMNGDYTNEEHEDNEIC